MGLQRYDKLRRGFKGAGCRVMRYVNKKAWTQAAWLDA